MLTRIKRITAVIAACILGIYLSPAFAEDALAYAYGLYNATLACEKTAEGYKVTRVDEVSRVNMRNDFGIEFNPDDPCLASIALFPPFFWSFATYANFAPGGASSQLPECLVWSISDASVSDTTSPGFGDRRKAMLVCDADDADGFKTVLVDDTGYTWEEGESCGVTLAKLTKTEGTRTFGPFAAKFKNDSSGQSGGLLFMGYGTADGPAALGVLECNVNEARNKLVVTYLETFPGGKDTTALGESCMEVMANQEANNGLVFIDPLFPIPAGNTTDPGFLILQGGNLQIHP